MYSDSVTLNGCGADISPDNPQLGRPQIINNADDNCASLSIEYRDEVLPSNLTLA
ncbi:MAG: hypothetical protein IPO62_16625 [Saprospiraceae bacterium]|nr:hypothetical protein [Saprospiraceae bacterium]